MQMTQEYIRNDGVADKAIVGTSRRKNGYAAYIKMGGIQKTVTSVHPDENDAIGVALRILGVYRDNAINY